MGALYFPFLTDTLVTFLQIIYSKIYRDYVILLSMQESLTELHE